MSAIRARLLLPSLFALAGFVVLLGLGTWQLERKAWKEGLIANLTRQLDAPPQPLPPPQSWATLDRSESEFRRVTFRAEFLPGQGPSQREARLFTGGTSLRDDIKAPGYFVFAPARLPDGSVVVVNRGYAPAAHPTATTPPAALPGGPVGVVGVLRWPDQPGWFDSDYSARDDLWFVRDQMAMAVRKNWGAVAPFYVEMEEPVPSGGLPKPGRMKVNLPNNHLQYAITWYGLAGVLVAVFAFWVRSRQREAKAAPMEGGEKA